VIGRKTAIGANAFLAEGVVIADFCRIGEASVVKANVKVWPYKEVEDGATLAMSLVWGERWSRSLFGRYGVSGLANIEISPEFAAKLGAASGAIVGRRRVMITSRDHHKASRMINRALMSGLLSVGVVNHVPGNHRPVWDGWSGAVQEVESLTFLRHSNPVHRCRRLL